MRKHQEEKGELHKRPMCRGVAGGKFIKVKKFNISNPYIYLTTFPRFRQGLFSISWKPSRAGTDHFTKTQTAILTRNSRKNGHFAESARNGRSGTSR